MEVHCFYCSKPITKHVPQKAHNYQTKDHVFPLAGDLPKGVTFSPKWENLNFVLCCRDCNSLKGRLPPIDWLVIMKSTPRAKAFAERLVALGAPMAEVFDAFRRRKR